MSTIATELKEFNSLQEVIDYLDTIPEKQWGRFIREHYNGKRCLLGHLDVALQGYHQNEVEYDEFGDILLSKSERLIESLTDVSSSHFVRINNEAPDGHIKETVINELKKFL